MRATRIPDSVGSYTTMKRFITNQTADECFHRDAGVPCLALDDMERCRRIA